MLFSIISAVVFLELGTSLFQLVPLILVWGYNYSNITKRNSHDMIQNNLQYRTKWNIAFLFHVLISMSSLYEKG